MAVLQEFDPFNNKKAILGGGGAYKWTFDKIFSFHEVICQKHVSDDNSDTDGKFV